MASEVGPLLTRAGDDHPWPPKLTLAWRGGPTSYIRVESDVVVEVSEDAAVDQGGGERRPVSTAAPRPRPRRRLTLTTPPTACGEDPRWTQRSAGERLPRRLRHQCHGPRRWRAAGLAEVPARALAIALNAAIEDDNEGRGSNLRRREVMSMGHCEFCGQDFPSMGQLNAHWRAARHWEEPGFSGIDARRLRRQPDD
jgi:hypothetical protein